MVINFLIWLLSEAQIQIRESVHISVFLSAIFYLSQEKNISELHKGLWLGKAGDHIELMTNLKEKKWKTIKYRKKIKINGKV